MRFILDAIFLGLYLILGIPVLWVLNQMGKSEKWKYKTDLIALRMVQKAFKVMLFIAGTKQVVIGEENVPKDQPVLYIPNHRSYFDILLLYSRVPGLTGFVSKDSMQKFYLLRDWMKKLHCLFLNRENPREGLKTILQGIENIKNGISMCIFPEGTRSKKGNEMLEFHHGSFKCALKTKAPIVPVVFVNSFKVLDEKGCKPVNVQIHYLKPIYAEEYAGMKTSELAELVKGRIEEVLKEYRA